MFRIDASFPTRQWATLCLLATLVFGMFAFVAPTHASMASASMTGSMDSMPESATTCFAQGCIQTHDTCKQHCVRPSSESASLEIAIAPQNNQQANSDSVQTFSIAFPDNAPAYIPILDRAPPIHQFLRSVIKRE